MKDVEIRDGENLRDEQELTADEKELLESYGTLVSAEYTFAPPPSTTD